MILSSWSKNGAFFYFGGGQPPAQRTERRLVFLKLAVPFGPVFEGNQRETKLPDFSVNL